MKRFFTQVLVLSVAAILLFVVVPVNASSPSQSQLGFIAAKNGVLNSLIDGVPLPPPEPRHIVNS